MTDNASEIAATERELAAAEEELRLDMAQAALDVAGIADPTPISDVAGAGLSLYRGDLLGAGLSLISVVPYVGDALGKTAKGARLARKIAAGKKKIEALMAKLKALKAARKPAAKSVDSAQQAAKGGVKAPCAQGRKRMGTPAQEERIKDIYAKAPKAQAEIDATAETIASEIPGARVSKPPGLKNPDRVIEKADTKYGGDVDRVRDVARNTVVVPPGNEDKALKRLKELHPDIDPKDIDVKQAQTDPLGYSGTNVILPTKSGLPAEVQINSPQMIYAKEPPEVARSVLGNDVYDKLAKTPGMPPGGKGHKYFEDWRSLDPTNPRRDSIATESRAYYDAVRSAAGGG